MPFFMEDYDEDLLLKSDNHLVPTQTAKRQPEPPQTQTQRADNSLAPEPDSPTKRTTVTVSRKRKRGGMLNGLDMNNIIEVFSDEMGASTVEDSVPASSVPVPSRKTRGSTNSTRVLVYDQKYHPLDEVLRPSQAAKRRAECELEDGDESEDDDSSFKVLNQGNADSDSDVENRPQHKRCKKLDAVATRCRTRRSSRKVGRNALYNTNVHPQDSQLALMTTDDMAEVDDEGSDMVSVTSDVTNGSANQMIAITSSPSGEESEEATHRVGGMYARTIQKHLVQDINDDASYSTISSPLQSTPQSSLPTYDHVQQRGHFDEPSGLQSDGLKDHGGSPGLADICLEPTPFQIYEEQLEEQLAKEALSPRLCGFDHDDKENRFHDSQFHPEAPNGSSFQPDIQARAALRPIDTHDMFSEHQDHFDHPSSFDGTDDRVQNIRRFARLPSLFDPVDCDSNPRIAFSTSSDIDSVLGSPVLRGGTPRRF